MKQIAILTSGGDAPGMNAGIRAITRGAIDRGVKVKGVCQGYAGLVRGEYMELDARAVGGIIHRGGTILGSARCPEFKLREVREAAVAKLHEAGIEGLVIIGGNGSQTGAAALHQMGFPVVGVASTIDNDLLGTDITIGVDTALNIALEAIDRLRVTASSHRRAFLVEVMGRDCGYLALMAALAGGAETVVIPEIETSPQQIADALHAAYERDKTHALAVVAEGAEYNGHVLETFFHENRGRLGFDVRVTTLGHVQRGGNPGAFDRSLATRLGVAAVDGLLDGCRGMLTGWKKGELHFTDLKEVACQTKRPDPKVLDLIHRLAK